MRILVIEDEPKTAAFLAKGLGENGFETELAIRGDTGREAAKKGKFDLIIMDLMLPGLDGWQLLKAVRGVKHPSPVLILTARDAVDERVRGLEGGAEDYLVKPFAFAELLARIRLILRRQADERPPKLREGDLALDLIARTATRAGQTLDLTPHEFDILVLLMQHAGQTVTRKMIAREVWNLRGPMDTNALDVALFRLRRKVDDGAARKLIGTVRGLGYRLESL